MIGLKGGLCFINVPGMKGYAAQNLMNEKRSLLFRMDERSSLFRSKHWANGWKKGFNWLVVSVKFLAVRAGRKTGNSETDPLQKQVHLTGS